MTTDCRDSVQDWPPGRLRPGLRVYAVGDIHGHADLLGRVTAWVAEDLGHGPVRETLTVFIGDYIDRGPASADVINQLARHDFPTPVVTLRGNHEQMFLDCLDDTDVIELWLVNGGAATAQSYGLELDRFHDAGQFRYALLGAIPPSHLEFLRGTVLSHGLDGYFFAHAGIQPGVPFGLQAPNDLLWIRHPFHMSLVDHGKVVVHGHTPVPRPESRPNRINLDTGAFRTGHLTCVALQDDDRRFMST